MKTSNKNRVLKRRKGGALAWVLIAMVMVTFIGATITLFMEANLQQSVAQEKNMIAYYACQSGINLGVAALLTGDGVDPDDATQDDTLLKKYGRNEIDTLTLTQSVGDNSEVDITITPETIEGGKVTWVKIHCVGKHRYRSKPYTSAGTLLISVVDKSIVRQSAS